jgi:cysteine protease ATG4
MGDGITTDNGWGCTLRSTQMLVATSLTRAILGDDYYSRTLSKNEQESLKQIYSLFADTENAPLGIHESASRSQVFKPGEWFSPGSAAFLMAAQVQSAFHTGVSSVSGMYTSTGRISSRQILSRLEEASGALIFIPLRLCSDDALEIARFSTDIRKWFTMPQFRGFVGGDYISQSYYFVGASEEYLYILDPHTVQPAVIEKVTDISMQFPPQPVVATMRWARLSPTMTLAFFVRDRTDLESIKNAKPLGLDVV